MAVTTIVPPQEVYYVRIFGTGWKGRISSSPPACFPLLSLLRPNSKRDEGQRRLATGSFPDVTQGGEKLFLGKFGGEFLHYFRFFMPGW